MELILVREAHAPRVAKRRASSSDATAGSRQRGPPGDVAVTGDVECNRSYGLLVACSQVLGEPRVEEVHVLHVAEAPTAAATTGSGNGAGDKGGAPGQKMMTKKMTIEGEEETKEDYASSRPSARKDADPSTKRRNQYNTRSSTKGQEDAYFIWQLCAQDGGKGSDEDDSDTGGEGDEEEEAGVSHGKKRAKSDTKQKRKRTTANDEEEEQSGDELRVSRRKTRTSKVSLPADAAQLRLVEHNPTKGVARMEIVFSDDHFGRYESPRSHLVLAAALRRGQPPACARGVIDSPSADVDGQFIARVEFTVQHPARKTRLPSPTAIHDADDPHAAKSPTISLSQQNPLVSAYPPNLPTLPPVPIPPASPTVETSTIPSLSMKLMAPLRQMPPQADPASETVPTQTPPLASAPRANRGAVAHEDLDWMNAFTSSTREAVLKNLHEKRAAESRSAVEEGPPAIPSHKRKNRYEGEDVLDVDSSARPTKSGTSQYATRDSGDFESEDARPERYGSRPASSFSSSSTHEHKSKQPATHNDQHRDSAPVETKFAPAQEPSRSGSGGQSLRATSANILVLLQQANKRVDLKFLQRFSAVHVKLLPVFEQFASPATQPTLILILLHALTLTGYCVDLIRFCYWVKDFSALTTDAIIEQATELSAQLVQLQFQQEVEEKLNQSLGSLYKMLSSLVELISGPVYESYQPEKEAADKTKGKKFISLAKGNAVPWIKEWLKSSYAEMQGQSVAKKMVYKDYLLYCNRVGIEPTTSSVLGKIFREVFPFVSTRRLGSRNNNITYYSNIGPTSNLLVHSASSDVGASSGPAPSPPQSAKPPSPPSPPTQVSIAPAPSQTSSTSRPPRSRSSSTNQPTTAGASAMASTSAQNSSATPAPGPSYHMGSFRSSTSNSGFSYYPSPSYYSSSSMTPSSAAPHSSTPVPPASSSSGSTRRSSSAQPTPASARQSSSTSSKESSKPAESAVEAASGGGVHLPGYASGAWPAHTHAASLPPYYGAPPGQPPPTAAEAAQSSNAPSAAGPAPAMPSPYPFIPPSTMALLAALPQLLSPYGIPPPPHAAGLYPASAPSPSAATLPAGYPGYPLGYHYPYPYPTAIDPQQAEAAAAAFSHLPPDQAIALLTHLQNPLAYVKREGQEDPAAASRSGNADGGSKGKRRYNDDESEEVAGHAATSSRRTHPSQASPEHIRDDDDSSVEPQPSTKRLRP